MTLFYFFIGSNAILSQLEGGIFLILLFVFLVYLLFFQQQAVVEDVVEEKTMSFNKLIMLLILGGFFLWLGSEILVDSAVSLAKSLGVSERIISISVVSIGTSIPELSASIIAIINKEKAISLGNLIGSNIFNILAVMGTTALILPIEVVDKALLEVDFLWMISI